MTNEKAVIYVVDDDASVLKSLERLLRSEGYEVKTFTTALEFLVFQHSDAPSCLILDLQMPEIGGLELQDRLADKGISIPVIFITAHGTVPITVRAMKAGAVDFLQKPVGSTELLNTVSGAISKDRQAKRDQKELKIFRERLETLSPREYEVFAHVVTGKLNKQIAFDLGTTERTIKAHRARVMQKTGAKSLADLVRFAQKLGIPSPGV